MPENAKKARRLWEEIFPAMDLDAVGDVVAANSVDHTARPGEPQGIDGVRDTMRFLDAAFSDQRFDVQRTVEEGDTVVVHFTHSAGTPARSWVLRRRTARSRTTTSTSSTSKGERPSNIGEFTTTYPSCSSSARCPLRPARH